MKHGDFLVRRGQAGRACKRSLIGYIITSPLAITSPIHKKAHWKFTAMARGFAAISCISALPFVDASISRRVMSPVTWATLGFHLRLTRWILAHGSKFSSAGNGTLLMRAITNDASAVFSWPWVGTPLTLH